MQDKEKELIGSWNESDKEAEEIIDDDNYYDNDECIFLLFY